MSILDYVLNKAVSSGFLKSRIQAGARALALGGAGWLVQHGLATNSTSQVIVASIMAIVAVYLQDLDVKIVDGKIKIALNETPPDKLQTVLAIHSPQGLTPEQEQQETKLLNELQALKPGAK